MRVQLFFVIIHRVDDFARQKVVKRYVKAKSITSAEIFGVKSQL